MSVQGEDTDAAELDSIAFAARLQRLRAHADDVSYAEIAARIGRRREADGLPPAKARVARSTVYDAFRAGRQRLRPDLIADIVRALGEDEESVRRWRADCIAARAASSSPPRSSTDAAPAAAAQIAPAAAPPAPRPMGFAALLPPPRLPAVHAGVLIAAGIGLNLAGGAVVHNFSLPLWLDMIGTAIIAVCIGPWAGAGVAAASILIGTFVSDTANGLPYTVVAVIGALVWGYGVHAWGLGRTPWRYLLLNLLTALACTVAAIPVTVLVYGGTGGHRPTDDLLAQLRTIGQDIWVAAFASNLPASIADKLLAGAVAVFVAWLLARSAPAGVPTSAAGPRRRMTSGS